MWVTIDGTVIKFFSQKRDNAAMMMRQRALVKSVLSLAFLIIILNFDVDVEPYDKGGRKCK